MGDFCSWSPQRVARKCICCMVQAEAIATGLVVLDTVTPRSWSGNNGHDGSGAYFRRRGWMPLSKMRRQERPLDSSPHMTYRSLRSGSDAPSGDGVWQYIVLKHIVGINSSPLSRGYPIDRKIASGLLVEESLAPLSSNRNRKHAYASHYRKIKDLQRCVRQATDTESSASEE
jgi:hypothetical protein